MQWLITTEDKYTPFVIFMSKVIFISVITLYFWSDNVNSVLEEHEFWGQAQ